MRTLLLAITIATAVCAGAYADNYQDCNSATTHPLKRERACRALIEMDEGAEQTAHAYVHLCKALADWVKPEAALVCESAQVLYSHPANLVNLGSIKYELGRYEEALRHFEEALVQDPNLEEALFNKRVVEIQLGLAQHSVAAAEPKR